MADDMTGGGGKVPIQYGGENNANFASFGGLVMSPVDYVRVLSAYAVPGRAPTSTHLRDMFGPFKATRGGVGCTEHGGMLPGTATYMCLRDDDVAIAAFFNKNTDGTMPWKGANKAPVDVWNEVASDVSPAAWPAGDQFASLLGPPIPPGPERLDVVATGNDSLIRDAAWERNVWGGWRGWWEILQGSAPAGGPVSVVSRAPDKLDVFVAGMDGRTYTAAWEAGRRVDQWRGWWNILTGHIPPGGAITAVSRHPDKLDVFLVSKDGGVYTAAWEAGVAKGAWRGWWRVGNLVAKPGSSMVGAVERKLSCSLVRSRAAGFPAHLPPADRPTGG